MLLETLIKYWEIFLSKYFTIYKYLPSKFSNFINDADWFLYALIILSGLLSFKTISRASAKGGWYNDKSSKVVK